MSELLWSTSVDCRTMCRPHDGAGNRHLFITRRFLTQNSRWSPPKPFCDALRATSRSAPENINQGPWQPFQHRSRTCHHGSLQATSSIIPEKSHLCSNPPLQVFLKGLRTIESMREFGNISGDNTRDCTLLSTKNHYTGVNPLIIAHSFLLIQARVPASDNSISGNSVNKS